MKVLYTLAFFIATSGAVSAQQVNSFSVAQAVDYAMQNAVPVKNALLDYKIQKEVNREVTSAALPNLSANTIVTRYFDIPTQVVPDFISPSTYQVLIDQGVKDGSGNPITMPAGGFGSLPFQLGANWTASGAIELSQILFDGQVFVGLQARASSLRFAERKTEVTKEEIKANVQKIYYQLVVGNLQMTSLDANIARFEKLLGETREIFKNGFAERLDVDKVNVQLNNLITEKIKVQNRLDAGMAGLKFLLNMPQGDSLVLTDSISEESLKEGLLDTAYQYTNRKDYQMLQEALKLNKFNVKRYRLSALPTVALFSSYGKNAQRNKFDFFDKGTWFTSSLVGARLSVPIFQGFARKARVDKARYEAQKTGNNIEQLKASIDYEVKQSSLNIRSALATVDNQKRNMQLAESVYNSTVLKYQQGLGSNIEIYNAQTELKVAQNNYYGALYDAIIARIDYLKAAGKL